MANNFILELDTTGPEIAINCPYYTIPDEPTEITIDLNEPAGWQDIYVVDGEGNKYPQVFAVDGNSLVGNITFNFCGVGVITIYAQAKDEVGNISALASKAINIIESLFITLISEEKSRKIVTTEQIRLLENSSEIMGLLVSEKTRLLSTSEVEVT